MAPTISREPSARALLPVPSTDHGLSILRYGHWGRPVLVFPSEAGHAEDFASNGMLDGIAGLVNDGRTTIFCVDSLDGWTWSADEHPIEERARRHTLYQAWLEQLAVPWIFEQLGGDAELITVGVSLGAYHAVQLAFQRPDIAPLAIGLSGNYDVTTFRTWGQPGDTTYFANPAAYVRNLHGDHLAWLRQRLSIVLVCGQGPFEEHPTRSISETRAFAEVVREKGIRCELDLWGYDSAHDWPWWRLQLAHHLPRFV